MLAPGNMSRATQVLCCGLIAVSLVACSSGGPIAGKWRSWCSRFGFQDYRAGVWEFDGGEFTRSETRYGADETCSDPQMTLSASGTYVLEKADLGPDSPNTDDIRYLLDLYYSRASVTPHNAEALSLLGSSCAQSWQIGQPGNAFGTASGCLFVSSEVTLHSVNLREQWFEISAASLESRPTLVEESYTRVRE